VCGTVGAFHGGPGASEKRFAIVNRIGLVLLLASAGENGHQHRREKQRDK